MPYALRHGYAQQASDQGVAIEVLAKLLGHASTESSRFYAEVSDGRALAAAKGLRLAGLEAVAAG